MLRLAADDVNVDHKNGVYSIEFDFISKSKVRFNNEFNISQSLYDAIVFLKGELANDRNKDELFPHLKKVISKKGLSDYKFQNLLISKNK